MDLALKSSLHKRSTDADADNGPNPIDVVVGLNIRRTRKLQSVSQDALALAVGVTFQQIQKYERGANRVSASMLCAIARRLDVSAGSLLPEEHGSDIPPTAHYLSRLQGLDDLITNFAKLTRRQQSAVQRLVRDLALRPEEPEDQAT